MKTVQELAAEAGGVKVENMHRSDPDMSNDSWVFELGELERFAALVRGRTLNEAEELCNQLHGLPRLGLSYPPPTYDNEDVDSYTATAMRIQAAIQALKS